MNFRQVAVLLGTTAAVVGEVRRALVAFDRSKHATVTGALPVVLLLGTGIALGAIVTRPELRRRVGEWLIGLQGEPGEPARAKAAPGPQPQPYANGV